MPRSPIATISIAGLLGGAATLLAAPGPGLDPADRPLHRHLLPDASAEKILQQADVRLLSWKDLLATLEKGRKARGAAASRKAPEAGKAGPGVVLRDLEATVHVAAAGEDASIRLQVEVELREDGWVRLPLLGPDALAQELVARGGTGHLIPIGGGSGALLEGPGKRTLEIVGWLPVHEEGHLRRVEVRIPPVPASRVRFDLPGDNLAVFTDPAPAPSRLEQAEGRTRGEAALPPGQPVRLQWFPRDAGLVRDESPEDAPDADAGLATLGPLVRATLSQALVFGHGRLEARLRIRAELHRAPLERLRLEVTGDPENLALLPHPAVAGSRAVPGGLEIQLRGKRRGELVLDASYRIQRDESTFEVEVPRFALATGDGAPAASTRRFYWIGRSTNVRVAPPTGPGFEPVGVASFDDYALPPGVQDALMRYRRVDPDAPLTLSVERYPDAPGVLTAVADSVRATTRVTPFGRASTRLEISLRSRTGAPLEVALPAGAHPLGFQVGENRVDPPRGEDGVYRIPLREGGTDPAEGVEVEVSYHQALPPFGELGKDAVALARLGIAVMNLSWTLAPEGGYRAYDLLGAARRPRRSFTRVQKLLPRPTSLAEAAPLTLRFRYVSERFLLLLRSLGLALGLWGGLLLCRLLVGAVPLELGLGLLAPVLVVGLTPDPRVLEATLHGMATAFLAGTLVGIRRLVTAWWRRRRLHKERARVLAEALPRFRVEVRALIARVRGEEPEAEGPDAKPGDPPPEPDPDPPAPPEPEPEMAATDEEVDS